MRERKRERERERERGEIVRGRKRERERGEIVRGRERERGREIERERSACEELSEYFTERHSDTEQTL